MKLHIYGAWSLLAAGCRAVCSFLDKSAKNDKEATKGVISGSEIGTGL